MREHEPEQRTSAPSSPASTAVIASAVHRAQAHLYTLQEEDGHWCGKLEGNTILESEYMLLLWFLGRGKEERFGLAAEHIRRAQLPSGGWPIYPDGPADVSTSIKAYFALKLAGDSPESEPMNRARAKIIDLGGIEAANSFTKIYLSIFGQYEWNRCPAIPPEMILLPPTFAFNIHEMSSWSRVMVVPLSVLWAKRPVSPAPRWASLHELRSATMPRSTDAPSAQTTEERLWRNLFLLLDRVLKLSERSPIKLLRRLALARAEAYLIRRMAKSDGVGAIFPPIINTVFALRALGYPPDHRYIAGQMRELEKLELRTADSLEVQPCKGPVWDTSLALRALVEIDSHHSDQRVIGAARWLLDRELLEPGDCAVKSAGASTGGWCFQYTNAFNPDCDDTAQVLRDLAGVRFTDPDDRDRALSARHRAIQWLFAMQDEDGGWAAFDRGCTKRVLTYVPFADHNAMIDPTCADITGRVLDALAANGIEIAHPAIRRGVEYLLRTQEQDGTWSGRWGTNYIYGTSLALTGLAAAGEDMRQSRIARAADWLRSVQQEGGGWGESPSSYDDPWKKGRGPVTATQTAWALLGLFHAQDTSSRSVQRGIEYLLRAQEPEGGWTDESWTGTGFPRVFYLRYHLYEKYFALLALAAYLRRQSTATR
jgi:squalene-hopene/tetraprenyl-beta-curcumene cyclase